MTSQLATHRGRSIWILLCAAGAWSAACASSGAGAGFAPNTGSTPPATRSASNTAITASVPPSPLPKQHPISVQPGLHGTVTWPDRSPVKGALLDFYPGGLTDPVTGAGYNGPAGHYFKTQTDSAGNYELPTACNGVICPAMYAFLRVPWPGGLQGECSMPLIAKGWSHADPSEPEILTVAPPAQVDYIVVSGYCQDLETSYINNYTDTNPNHNYTVLPLTDGSAAPNWQQVEQYLDTGVLPVGDPCVVGRWATRPSTLTLNGANGPVQLTGGAAVQLTIRSDGHSVWDYGASQPYVGTDNANAVELHFTGVQITTVHATPAHIFTETLLSYSVTYYYVINGLIQPQQQATFDPATSYTCSGSSFTESAAGGSVSFGKLS